MLHLHAVLSKDIPRRIRGKTPAASVRVFRKTKYSRNVEAVIQAEKERKKHAIPKIRFEEMVSEALTAIQGDGQDPTLKLGCGILGQVQIGERVTILNANSRRQKPE